MRDPIGFRAASGGYRDFSDVRFDRDAVKEADPPVPLQILTRLGVLLAIAPGFGLAAQALVRLTA
jgi:hypothetical protein